MARDLVAEPAGPPSPAQERDRASASASAAFFEQWASRCRRAVKGPWFSVAVVVAMVVIGYAIRRSALPTTALWFDDAWVATGAIYFTPSQLIAAGSAHPGFTVSLRLFHEVVS